MSKIKSLTLLTGLSISIMALSACQSATTSEVTAKQDRSAKIAEAIRKAEKNAGRTQSLSTLESRYKRNSDDEVAATEYAYALRKKDYLPEATAILAPFAKEKSSTAATKTEYASIKLAQGDYAAAEEFAQQAIRKDDSYGRAYHNLGIALDAQGHHKKAERAFRKGLDLWEDDPTTIMNNLALNLASQNHLEESLEILNKAQVISPERREIERNIRIVTALLQSQGTPVPKPSTKPERSTTAEPSAEEAPEEKSSSSDEPVIVIPPND